jgi:hypothetical protein
MFCLFDVKRIRSYYYVKNILRRSEHDGKRYKKAAE